MDTFRQEAAPVASLTDADVNLAFDGCLVQWCVVPVVSGVGVCTLTQQQADYLGVTEGTGVVQGDEPAVVPGVNISTRLQQVLHHVLPSKA